VDPEQDIEATVEPARRGLDRQELAAIFAGGCVGAISRSALAKSLVPAPGTWPWGTFLVNVIGAAMLGYLVTRLQERLPPSLYERAFLGTGICGALTTFSTLMVELLGMLESAHYGLAAAYGSASVACGLSAVFFASKLVRRGRVAS
jgi:fluoride exporter